MNEILLNVLTQLIYFVGYIFIVGYIISLFNRFFYRSVGGGMATIYATGLIGTPIHELSHALMCIVFGHKINEMKLFQIDDENGVLGYVNHSYNRRNIYHLIGNYFIGVAPIIGGTAVLYLGIKYMIPETSAGIMSYIESFSESASGELSFALIGELFSTAFGMIGVFFGGIKEGFTFWLLLVLALCIALHMNLSGADIRGAVPAIPLLAVALAIPNIILGFLFPDTYSGFLSFMSSLGGFIAGMLMLSLVFSAFCFVIGLAIKIIKGALGRR